MPFTQLITFVRRSGLLLSAFALLATPGVVAAQSDIVLNPAAPVASGGRWSVVSDTTAAGGNAIHHPNANAPKATGAAASPTHFFELTFEATAGVPYRLWLHGKAQNDYWGNDSVFVQFSNSVTAAGAPIYRIGTTSSSEVNLEECSGAGLRGWMWQDNGWGAGVLGPTIQFATTGTQTLRVQTREDGLMLDQIVLSPSTYLQTAPADVLQPSAATPAAENGDVVLSPVNPGASAGRWSVVSDSSAAGGSAIRHPNANAAKVTSPSASPANYFELTFEAAAGTPYRLWLHGKAENDYWSNDSVYVQFSSSVTPTGSPIYRIGTTSAADVNLEECGGCGLRGWMWQDNGWGVGVLGPTIRFATTGTHTLRVQTREDGLSIDQIVLSPSNYLHAAPTGILEPTTPTEPVDPPPTAASTPVKVLHWNIHHGVGTDGVYNLQRIVTWIVKTGANVVSLNEVEKFTSWGNEDQPARFAALLAAGTGKPWYYHFAQRNSLSRGQGNMVLSTFPIEDTESYQLSYSRSVSRIQIVVDGVRVNVFSTHLDADSSTRRMTQISELKTWASSISEQKIIAGDFNAWPGTPEPIAMGQVNFDAWAVARAAGTAVAYAGNTAGNTRNTRIDYIWYSKGASGLVLKAMQIFDTRDASGVMPSDHRPILATFEVK